jgi:methionyl-tRNA synthetase
MKMASANLEKAPEIPEKSIPQEFFDYLEKFEINKATDFIWNEIGRMDLFIQENQPFKLMKDESTKAQGASMIQELVARLYSVARMLNPILPETSAKIKSLIKENKSPEVPLFARKD